MISFIYISEESEVQTYGHQESIQKWNQAKLGTQLEFNELRLFSNYDSYNIMLVTQSLSVH